MGTKCEETKLGVEHFQFRSFRFLDIPPSYQRQTEITELAKQTVMMIGNWKNFCSTAMLGSF